jgi:hypothetical protein
VPEGETREWPAQCRSCATKLHGPYCSACGESHVHGRLDLRTLVEQAFEGLINLDTRALRTIGELTVAPGKVCRDYLDGRRVGYIHPFKYAFACFTVAVLVAEGLYWLNGPPADPMQAQLQAFQLRWGLLINFLAMPLLAALLWSLFARAPRRLRWVEHYVVVLYAFGHAALIQTVLGPILETMGTVGSVVFAGMAPAMLCWTAMGVYETRWWTIPRVLLAFVAMQTVVFFVLRLLVPDLLG